MIAEKFPVAAVLVAVSVSALVVVALGGLKDPVTPPGKPETDRATLPLKLFFGVTVMVLDPLPPWVRVYGDAEKLKSGVAAAAGASADIAVEKILLLPTPPVLSP